MSNKLTPRERFKLNLANHGLLIKTEGVVACVDPVAKKPVKAKPVKKKPRPVKDGLVKVKKVPMDSKEYAKAWRARNKDKCDAYRLKQKNDPVKRALRREYERNRPDKLERLEASKLRHRKLMENPLYAKKERLRGKLRCKNITAVDRLLLSAAHQTAKRQWKEYMKIKKGSE